MSPQQDPLAGLHDIVLPDAVGLWPLAPGWWILIALLTALIVSTSIYVGRHRKSTIYRRQAKQSLDHWLAQKKPDSMASAQDWAFFNHWCKRILLCQTDRAALSSLAGEQWQAYLKQQAHPLPNTVIERLGDQLYCATPAQQPPIPNTELHQIGLHWLSKQPAITHDSVSAQKEVSRR